MANKLRELWEERLADQKTSGKSIRNWCKENSIKENRFYYWRRELQPETIKKPVVKKPKWLPLEIEKTNPSPALTVHIGQAKIEIPKDFDQYHLKEIIQVLQGTII